MRRRPRKSFLVIGLGRFGSSLAIALTRMGHEVLGVDHDMVVVEEMRDEIALVQSLDAANANAIIELDVEAFDTCVVATGTNLAQSILITMHLRDMGAKRVVAKAVSDQHAKILETLGADVVVFPERDMGERMAHTLASPFIVDFFEVAPDVSVMEIEPPEILLNKTLSELQLRPRFGITVLGIRRNGEFNSNPTAETSIQPGDELVVLGQESAIENLLES